MAKTIFVVVPKDFKARAFNEKTLAESSIPAAEKDNLIAAEVTVYGKGEFKKSQREAALATLTPEQREILLPKPRAKKEKVPKVAGATPAAKGATTAAKSDKK